MMVPQLHTAHRGEGSSGERELLGAPWVGVGVCGKGRGANSQPGVRPPSKRPRYLVEGMPKAGLGP
jgi:hypothetical protein